MKVLGIDFSLNGTGLAVYDGNDIIYKKMFTMTKKHETDDPEHFIFVPKMEDTMSKLDIVSDLIVNCDTEYDFVLMEDHIGTYYNWMDGYGIVKYLLHKKGKPYVMASPTMIKKYAGNGKSDKNMMSFFLRNDYGFDFDHFGRMANNLVDASWMAIMGYSFYKIYIEKVDFPETPARTKILKDLNKKWEKSK